MRDLLGGISVMAGAGFLAWGAAFHFSHPQYAEGRTAMVFGLVAFLTGLALVLPKAREPK
jgi:Ni/Fe-hydrogenase subunit HybB-like protein